MFYGIAGDLPLTETAMSPVKKDNWLK